MAKVVGLCGFCLVLGWALLARLAAAFEPGTDGIIVASGDGGQEAAGRLDRCLLNWSLIPDS